MDLFRIARVKTFLLPKILFMQYLNNKITNKLTNIGLLGMLPVQLAKVCWSLFYYFLLTKKTKNTPIECYITYKNWAHWYTVIVKMSIYLHLNDINDSFWQASCVLVANSERFKQLAIGCYATQHPTKIKMAHLTSCELFLVFCWKTLHLILCSNYLVNNTKYCIIRYHF